MGEWMPQSARPLDTGSGDGWAPKSARALDGGATASPSDALAEKLYAQDPTIDEDRLGKALDMRMVGGPKEAAAFLEKKRGPQPGMISNLASGAWNGIKNVGGAIGKLGLAAQGVIAPEDRDVGGAVKAFATHVPNVPTLGTLDKVSGLGRVPADWLYRKLHPDEKFARQDFGSSLNPFSPSGLASFRAGRDDYRGARAKEEAESPGASALGTVAGALTMPVGPEGAAAADSAIPLGNLSREVAGALTPFKAASPLGRLAAGAGNAAIPAAALAAGSSNASSVGGLVGDTLKGGAVGGALGLLGAAPGAARQKMSPTLRKWAEERAFKSLNPTLKQEELATALPGGTRGMGRTMLDEGVVTPLGSVEKMAERAKGLKSSAGHAIGSSIDAGGEALGSRPSGLPSEAEVTRAAGLENTAAARPSAIEDSTVIDINRAKNAPDTHGILEGAKDALAAPLKKTRSNSAVGQRIEDKLSDLQDKIAQSDDPFQAAIEVKRELAEEAYGSAKNQRITGDTKEGLYAEAMDRARSQVDDEIRRKLGAVDPDALAKYDAGNVDFQRAKLMSSIAAKSAARAGRNRSISLTDYLSGGAGSGIGAGVGAMLGGPAGAGVGGIIGGGLGAMGNKLGRGYGNQILATGLDRLAGESGPTAGVVGRASSAVGRMPRAEQISDALQNDPERLGPYAPALQKAAQRGPQGVAAAHYVLYQRDPQYQETVKALGGEK